MLEDALEQASVALLVLSGLPGSGKSTLSRQLEQTCQMCWAQVCVRCVCFDKFLHQLQQPGIFSPTVWQASRSASMQAVDRELSSPAPEKLTLVIADDNMFYASMRRQCYQLARQRGAAFIQIHCRCNLDVVLQRNARRPAGAAVPDSVIRQMAEILEAPNPTKNSWEQHSLVLDTTSWGQAPDGTGGHLAVVGAGSGAIATSHSPNMEEIWERICALWGGPPARLASEEESLRRLLEGQAANAASSCHALDIATRKLLASAMKKVPQAHRATVAAQLNSARKQILQRAKACSRINKQPSSPVQVTSHTQTVFPSSISSINTEQVVQPCAAGQRLQVGSVVWAQEAACVKAGDGPASTALLHIEQFGGSQLPEVMNARAQLQGVSGHHSRPVSNPDGEVLDAGAGSGTVGMVDSSCGPTRCNPTDEDACAAGSMPLVVHHSSFSNEEGEEEGSTSNASAYREYMMVGDLADEFGHICSMVLASYNG